MVSIALALGVGTVAGLLAGYFGGLVDWIVMRTADVVLSIPPVLLAIGVVAILGPSLPNLILTIAVLYAPRFARVAYSSPKLCAGWTTCWPRWRSAPGSTYVLRKAILPAIIAPLIVQGSLALGAAMLLESGLSFIGLGAQPPTPSWGRWSRPPAASWSACRCWCSVRRWRWRRRSSPSTSSATASATCSTLG